MIGFEPFLIQELDRLETAKLRRRLQAQKRVSGSRVVTAEGESLIQFASNDYLGLSVHPAVCEAAARAAREAGAGSGSARLVCGSHTLHAALERALATFKGAAGALTFSSGFAAAVGVIPAVVGRGDCVVLDRLAHACLVDAARLSGARLRVFRHNDPADLERILVWARQACRGQGDPAPGSEPGFAGGGGRVLIVTESVFSMDGDRAPLRELVALKERYGFWLLVDEAHATGIAGPGGRGVVAEWGLEGRVELPMGTLGKALGAAGGFITGSAALVEFLVQRARSFVFSTAPPPAVAAAAMAALGVVGGEEGAALRARLDRNVRRVHDGLASAGWSLPPAVSPILPVRVGPEEDALRLATELRREGYWVPAIRFPTVPRGRARLRVTVSAAHGEEEIEGLLSALARAADRAGVRPG